MLGFFKKKSADAEAHDAAVPKWDDPGMGAAEGLPLLMASLKLSRNSRNVEENLEYKLMMLGMIVERSKDRELPRKLLIDCKADANGKIDMGQLQDFDELTPYGQSIVMLLYGMGNFAAFYGDNLEGVVRNTLDSDAVEARSLIYMCRAFERFGNDELVARPIQESFTIFRATIEKFALPRFLDARELMVARQIVQITRHIQEIAGRPFQPTRMPGVSPTSPDYLQPLDLSEFQALAMSKAG